MSPGTLPELLVDVLWDGAIEAAGMVLEWIGERSRRAVGIHRRGRG